ncbi:hypothetical protein [uncultured Pseudacidovorax sp.]|uniref:GAP1-N1 domain-containing protein n=1 Tax=uncultured Pseudacidovorax sp. TaxID=679313 RepID=UPI0025EEC4D1|nr:hypothetical protein [uncultured Pseudacidovorax sp.]
MIRVESQLHGYRHGHELLAASVALNKADQAILDRLSDVAGPLRTGELFSPYLSCYPLPSGQWNVLARTWLDVDAKRPGCVRTLSLLLPSEIWARSLSIIPFAELLRGQTLPIKAPSFILDEPAEVEAPPVQAFSVTDLTEALFLEESKPVAIFDAPNPELIATRLLSALWPSMRRVFSLSTFALSPRRIEGRDFNLVFAPRSARQKFAEWPGRRVDGAGRPVSRHRWTSGIVKRVFLDPVPHLLDEYEVSADESPDSATASVLRISLLWEELLGNVQKSPTAALGLLDIARTKSSISAGNAESLTMALRDAIIQAATTLESDEAWMLIGSMTRKIRGTRYSSELSNLQAAAMVIAGRDPASAMHFLRAHGDAIEFPELIQSIGLGLASGTAGARVVLDHGRVDAEVVLELLANSPVLVKKIVDEPSLQQPAQEFVRDLPVNLLSKLRHFLVPHLSQYFHVQLASQLIASMGREELLAFVRKLISENGFAVEGFLVPILAQARRLSETQALRDTLMQIEDRGRRSALILSTLDASVTDLEWAVTVNESGNLDVGRYIVDTTRAMANAEFEHVMSNRQLRTAILKQIPGESSDLSFRLLQTLRLPIDEHVQITVESMSHCAADDRVAFAFLGLDRALRENFDDQEIKSIIYLLESVENVFNPGWAISHGLDSTLPGSVIARNLVAFDNANSTVRTKFCAEADGIVSALDLRWSLDLGVDGAQACANLLSSAVKEYISKFLPAAGRMTRLLFRSRGWPVSSIVPVVFPVVYRELASHHDVPDVLKFVPFFDWDKCKSARQALVDAFVGSPLWRPEDFAETICQCPHIERFLECAQRRYRGPEFLDALANSLGSLPAHDSDSLQFMLHNVISRRGKW